MSLKSLAVVATAAVIVMLSVAVAIALLGGDTVTFRTLAPPIGVPAVLATFGLVANESARRARDRQRHKERRYEGRVRALESFYSDSTGEQRSTFSPSPKWRSCIAATM